MSWYLCEIDDGARSVLAALQKKSDWYVALGQFDFDFSDETVCDLGAGETWPLWIEATEGLPAPLGYMFTGEIYAEPRGSDADVGFLGANAVRNIAALLNESDEFFLELLEDTRFGKHGGDCRPELAILPLLRRFYSRAASNNKALVLIFPW